MLNNFKRHITSHYPSLFTTKILVATSSGLDSMVLTDLCIKLNLSIALAHCNFQLRGEENLEEEAFMLNFASQNSLQIFTRRFNTSHFAKTCNQSTQMAARELRYQWFDDLTQNHDFNCILTAHHADDNLETFLINLGRASGIEGLCGIPKHKANIIRPLLPFSRDEILNYANENKLQWCEDSSNASLTYLRNKLRHKVVPELKSIFPNILDQLWNTQMHLSSTQKVFENHLKIVEAAVREFKSNDEIHYDIEALKAFGQPKDYVFSLLKQYGFSDWVAIQNLIFSQSGKQVISSTHKVFKNRHVLIVTPLKEFTEFEMEIKDLKSEINIPYWSKILKISTCKQLNLNQRDIIYVDSNTIEFPLTLRLWKSGDYFFPEGMTGKKKLSKFFKDEKLSLTDKSRALVLCSKDTIVWVVGMRADRRFIPSKNTTSITKIYLHNAIN